MNEEIRNSLAVGTVLDQYRIEGILGKGGFGITYLVTEVTLGKSYAMKELLPDGVAVREADSVTVIAASRGLEEDFEATRRYFITEAQVLAGIEHEAVVAVHRLFQSNGTCYMVMDYVKGVTLTTHLNQQGGKIASREEFERLFYPLMAGLEVLHGQQLVHRDIKPGNIMVRPDGKPVLLDFGAVCRVQSKTMTVTQMVSAGYSPFEQYTTRAKQGPYTDIYALGATMVKAITGKKPDDASDRVYGDEYQSLGDQKKYQSIFGRRILSAIDAALIMEADKRPQTMVEWRGMMVEILRPKKKSSPSRGREVLAVTEKILDDSPSSEKSLPAKLSPVSPTCRIDDDVQSFSWVGRWKIFVDTIKRKLLS